MALSPETYDRLTALWKRMDRFPEAKFTEGGGAVLNNNAYTAFLEARMLIDKVRMDLFAETKSWQPIETFFSAEPETPMVLLWCDDEPEGEQLKFGYWDDDAGAWYREGEGADSEATPLHPAKWKSPLDAIREAEFVSVARIA